MNCCHGEGNHSTQHHGHGRHGTRCSCGCGGHTGPMFWSKRKKIEILEEDLKHLQEHKKELEELIRDLKDD